MAADYNEDPYQHIVRIRIQQPRTRRQYFIRTPGTSIPSYFHPSVQFSSAGGTPPQQIAMMPENPAGLTITVDVDAPDSEAWKTKVPDSINLQMMFFIQDIDTLEVTGDFLAGNVIVYESLTIFVGGDDPFNLFRSVSAYTGPVFGFNGDGRLSHALSGDNPQEYIALPFPI